MMPIRPRVPNKLPVPRPHVPLHLLRILCRLVLQQGPGQYPWSNMSTGSPARDRASASLPPPNPTSYGPSGPSPPPLDLESDDPEPDREHAPSPTPTIPGHVPSTHIPVPAIADHRNRPWPPADDRTLIRWKMDSKSRPSWKTIASRMNALRKAARLDGNG